MLTIRKRGIPAKPKNQSAKKLALERTYQDLVQQLISRDFTVRREELKRGLSWRVTSGTCRMFDNRLVIVDRRLTIEDQVAFLSDVIKQISGVKQNSLLTSGISVDPAEI
jgi:hypothetical protein